MFKKYTRPNFSDDALGTRAMDIYDEGVLVKTAATSINVVGGGIQVSADGFGVRLYSPDPYPTHFNSIGGTTTTTVVPITTSNRYVSEPTLEGTPFYSGGSTPWGGDGSTHPCTRTSPLVWTPGTETTNLILFETLTSVFTVTLTDSTGTIATYTTPAITGNVVLVDGSITVTITSWAATGTKYQANVSFSVDIATLLPNSGFFSILLRHTDNGTNYDYTA